MSVWLILVKVGAARLWRISRSFVRVCEAQDPGLRSMHARWPMTTARIAFLLFLVLSLASPDSTSTLFTRIVTRQIVRSRDFPKELISRIARRHSAHVRRVSLLRVHEACAMLRTRFTTWFRIAQPPHDAPSFRSIVSG